MTKIKQEKLKVLVPHKEAADCYDSQGREICDSQPAAMPIGFTRPLTIQEMIANATRNELRSIIDSQNEDGVEEELLDEDNSDGPTSPYELVYDPATRREVTQETKKFLDEKRLEFEEFVKFKKSQTKKPLPKKKGKKPEIQEELLDEDTED